MEDGVLKEIGANRQEKLEGWHQLTESDGGRKAIMPRIRQTIPAQRPR